MGAMGRAILKHFSAYMLIYEREFVLPNPLPASAPSPAACDAEQPSAPTATTPMVGQPGNGTQTAVATTPSATVVGGGNHGQSCEWEPPWSGVPRPSELVPKAIFQVRKVLKADSEYGTYVARAL